MRVTDKTDELFHEIENINNAAFIGPEKPNSLALRYAFDHGDIFLPRPMTGIYAGIHGYAIVTKDGGHPFLWSIAVDSPWRKQGLGTEMLTDIIRYYEWVRDVRLDLTVNVNNPAQKLYFDHGFRAIRVYPDYYGPVAGLRMRRKLC